MLILALERSEILLKLNKKNLTQEFLSKNYLDYLYNSILWFLNLNCFMIQFLFRIGIH